MYKIVDPNTVFIEEDAVIEEGVIINPNVTIRGNSIIGKNTIIDSNTIIINSEIGEDNYIISSVIEDGNRIGNKNRIGPFSHLRENNTIGNSNEIGSYVEIKNSTVENDNFIKHLAYVGNTVIGNKTNLGAGVVFANYHSKKDKKFDSIVEDNVSIGSNTTLISPVKVERNSLVGAGSVVTKNIEQNSLYINRTEEIYKKGYYEGDCNDY